MMEFWPEHQGQSPLYAKFGTVPGRNCTHNYHDRHQATHYPLYYGEQQDQGRESSYWTVPGSRTGGAPQDYTSWTDPELSAPASSHFPFILDRHTQQHQDLGEYQPHEARGRDWTAAQRAAREYERGFLREGWQRRWEPCSPVRYNREVSAKRSESSYRELEAWAARYSHSLPRRRRIEAELRGASQGLLESSRTLERDSRGGTDPQVAALQQVRQPANIRESAVWDRGGRLQTPTYYPPQAPAPDTTHLLDIKEKTGYQRKMFSQPPGYIAPPPYNSPHKSSPVMHHCDTSWEQEGKRQAYWSQPTLRKQDVSADVPDRRKAEKEDFTKPDGNRTCAQLGGLKLRGPETETLQAGSPISVQNTLTQRECMSLQQPQTIPTVQNTSTNEQTSKVIEGRKFRLNKKTGGMTIFCLVSRIAGTTETPSLPLCTSQTNIQSTELAEVSKGLGDRSEVYQTQKLADEVDFRAPALTERSNTSDARNLKDEQKETATCEESEMLGDNLPNKAETGVVSPEKANVNDANSPSGRQVAQSVQPTSVKYPLWREPSFTSRAETESSSTLMKANSEEGEPGGTSNQEECAAVHPINVEVRRLDIKEDTQSEDSKGLLVIDTTCVVVKMELIPSPKKEHVHYVDATPHADDSPLDTASNTSQTNQDVIPNAETNDSQIDDRPEPVPDSDLGEIEAPEGEGDISLPFMPSSSISERESLEERAERILGISLHDCFTDQQPEHATSFPDSSVEERDAEVEASPITDDICDANEEQPGDTTEEEQSQNHLEVGQTEDAVHLKESDDAEDQVKNEDGERFGGPQEQESTVSEEKDADSQLEADIKTSQETKTAEDALLEPTGEDGTTEQSQEENQPDDASSQDSSQCFSPPKDLSNSSLLSHSNLITLSHTSQSNTEEDLDPQLDELDTAENLAPCLEDSSLSHTPSQQLPSPLPAGSIESSPSCPPSPDLVVQTAEAMCGTEGQDEEGETSQLINNEISDAFEDLEDQEVESQQQSENEQPDNAACVSESDVSDEQQTKESDKDPTDLLEQTEISEENAIDVNTLQQQLECVQAEDVTCVKESCTTVEQLQQEASEDSADLLTISQENLTDSQTQAEVTIVTQQFDIGQEEDTTSKLKESYMIEEQSQKEDREDEGLSVQTSEISQGNLTDSQAEVEPLQHQFYYGQEEDVSYVTMTEEQSQIDTDEGPADPLETTISQENVTDSQTQAEVTILPQQFDIGQEEDTTSEVKESHMTEEQSQKEDRQDMTDDQVEVKLLQDQLYCGREEDVSCVTMTEEQSQKEDSEDTGLSVQTTEISKENETDSQEEIKLSQHQFCRDKEEDVSCVTLTEEQSQTEADEDPAHLFEQTISQENATGCQTQTETDILQETEPQTEPSDSPSASDSQVSHSPLDVLSPPDLTSPPHASHKSDPEPESHLEMDSVCPSALNPVTADAGIPETVPPPLQLDSCEESCQFSSSSTSDSAPDPASSAPTPPHEGGEGVFFDFPHKEEPQYPKSLWDAVNRIRKHTAPDSENEEEEVSEQWDPESTGEDLCCPDVVLGMNSERIFFDEAGRQHRVSGESVEDVELHPCHEELSGHAEEDTLSCSSTSSRSSGDTVIVAEDDEAEETQPDASTEEMGEEFPTSEGERCCCSGEVKETAAKEEGEDEQEEGDAKEFCPSEECTAEVENLTAETMEMMETEQKENEEEGVTPSEVAVVSDEVTGGDCTALAEESEPVT